MIILDDLDVKLSPLELDVSPRFLLKELVSHFLLHHHSCKLLHVELRVGLS